MKIKLYAFQSMKDRFFFRFIELVCVNDVDALAIQTGILPYLCGEKEMRQIRDKKQVIQFAEHVGLGVDVRIVSFDIKWIEPFYDDGKHRS